MRRLLPALLTLLLVACGTNGGADDVADLFDGEIGDVAVDGEVGGDVVPTEVGDDGTLDGTEPPDVGPDVVVTTGELELFTTAPKGDLRAIWGSAERFYAVGEDGVILRRQGSTWTPMKSPTDKDLLALFGNGDGDLYAGGVEGTLLHFDGAAWELVDTGLDLDLSEIALRGIWGAEGQFYVVGDKGTILHYFEGKWKKDESLSTYTLASIWGVSLVDIYVGAAGGAVLRKLGGAWSSQQVTQGSVTLSAFMGLSAKELFAGGSNGSLAVHDSDGWSPKLSNDAYNRTLNDVWAYAPGDVWFVGDEGALIRSQAGKWNTAEIAGPFYKNHSFYGLWGRADGDSREAFAVGEKGAVLRYDGTDWKDELSSAAVDLADLDGGSLESALAVGGDGTLLRFDGEDWYGLDRVTDKALRGVAEREGTFVAVGDKGTVVTVVGDSPTKAESGVTANLHGACAGNGFVAVGEQGKLLTSADGTTWTPLSSGTFDTLRDCVVDGNGTVWAVGDQGRIVRFEDGEASISPVATIANLHRIAMAPDGTLYAVGDNGLLLEGGDDGWQKVYEEPGLFLYGIAAFDGIVYAVGWAGRILAYDPATGTMSPVDAPESGVLLQVWGPDADHLFVVGKKGKMLRTKTNQ